MSDMRVTKHRTTHHCNSETNVSTSGTCYCRSTLSRLAQTLCHCLRRFWTVVEKDMRFVDTSLLAFPDRWIRRTAPSPSGVLQGVVWHGEKCLKSVVLVGTGHQFIVAVIVAVIVKIVVLLRVVCVPCLCFIVTEMPDRIFGQSHRTLRTCRRKTVSRSTS